MATPYHAAALLPHETPWRYEWAVAAEVPGNIGVLDWDTGIDTPLSGADGGGVPPVINDTVFLGADWHYSEDGATWTSTGESLPALVSYWANDAQGNLYFAVLNGGVSIYQMLNPYSGQYVSLGTIALPGEDLGQTDVYMDENCRWHAMWMAGTGADRVLNHSYTDDFGLNVTTTTLVASSGSPYDLVNLHTVTVTGKGKHVFCVVPTGSMQAIPTWYPGNLWFPGYWGNEYIYTSGLSVYASHDRGLTWQAHGVASFSWSTADVAAGSDGQRLQNASMRYPLCVGEHGLILLFDFLLHTGAGLELTVIEGRYWEDYATMTGYRAQTGSGLSFNVTYEPKLVGFMHSTRVWSGPDTTTTSSIRSGDDLIAHLVVPISTEYEDFYMAACRAVVVLHPQTGAVLDFYILANFGCYSRLADLTLHHVPAFVDWHPSGYSFWW